VLSPTLTTGEAFRAEVCPGEEVKKVKPWLISQEVEPLIGKKEECGCERGTMGQLVKPCEKHKDKVTDVTGGPK